MRGIRRVEYIYNFDETSSRIGWAAGQENLVPTWIKKLYAVNPENRRSITVVEYINADGAPPLAPTIIVPARRHTENFFTESITGKEQVLPTDQGLSKSLKL